MNLFMISLIAVIVFFWGPSGKTAGDFPGEEIAASDLGLAPHPFCCVSNKGRAPNRENSSEAAHMSDRTSTQLSFGAWSRSLIDDPGSLPLMEIVAVNQSKHDYSTGCW